MMTHYVIRTARNYDLRDVASALQKAIRRGDAKLAGYWTIELHESGYAEYAWRRLLTISAEDVWGIITGEVLALYQAWKIASKGGKQKSRMFLAKAAILLCLAKKCRDADHLTNLVYDQKALTDEQITKDLKEARKEWQTIPNYAYDVHTALGRSMKKTKKDFFNEEFAALQPREKGLFDDLIPAKTG